MNNEWVGWASVPSFQTQQQVKCRVKGLTAGSYDRPASSDCATHAVGFTSTDPGTDSDLQCTWDSTNGRPMSCSSSQTFGSGSVLIQTLILRIPRPGEGTCSTH